MTIEYVDVTELEPHELNREIYTNRSIDDLVDKIDTYGFQETHPLLVTPDDKILSGHRRWRAAQEVGLLKVPVRRVSPDDEGDELFMLLTANEYRDKTAAEKINEAEAWERIEREKARERQGSREDITQNIAESETGEAKEKAAEKVGASKETIRKGQKVKEKAESGDETAQREWKRMERGEQSVHGAYSEVKQSENALDDTHESDAADASTPIPKYEWVNTTPKDVEVQARDCDTDGEYRIFVNGDEYAIDTELYSKLFHANP